MIFTVTLNPALDKILFLERFERSRTNRLTRTLETVGGKGTHVFVNLRMQGVACKALGIALGGNGSKILRILEGYGDTVDLLFYDLPGMNSRTNYEMVESTGHACTMLAERGPRLPKSMTDALLAQAQGLIGPGDLLVLSGDASNVEDPAIYARMTEAANRKGARVFVDASGPYLKEALQARPFLIKPNLEELSFIAGRDLRNEAEVIEAMHSLDDFGIPMVAMTWSKQGAIVKSGADFYRVNPLQVDTVNEGGCGDAFLSGLVAGIERRCDLIETLRTAAAVGAAAAECELTVGFDMQRAEELKKQVRIDKIEG